MYLQLKKVTFFLSFLLVLINVVFAQSVGIGTTSPDASAILELKATNKGFLPPSMTIAQKILIPAPKPGLMIYQTDGVKGLYVYDGSSWVAVSTAVGTAANVWSLSGNAGTIATANFIGTTDNKPLKFRINNSPAGNMQTDGQTFLGLGAGAGVNNTGINNAGFGGNVLASNTTGSNTTGIGIFALANNTTGSNNIANGYAALILNNTGYSNVAVGMSALFKNTDRSNLVAVGDSALFNNTEGTFNTAVGSKALYANTTGYVNTANGYQSLFSNTIGFHNTAVGVKSLHFNKDGSFNTAMGAYSLFNNTSGIDNTAIGNYSLYKNSTGRGNTALGSEALYSDTSGKFNTASGAQSLFSNTSGNYNVANGGVSLYSNTTGNYNVANGYNSLSGNVDGDYNTGSGYKALYNNISGTNNTASGSFALAANTTGNNNTASGNLALGSNYSGTENTAIGDHALYSNTQGNSNTAAGFEALNLNTTGILNNAFGYKSLYFNTTGNRNAGIGDFALFSNASGSFNTGLGYAADVSSENLTNATAVGNRAQVSSSNSMVLGSVAGVNGATSNINVGIGVTSPQTRLHINPNGGGSVLIGTNRTSGGYTNLEMGISTQSGGNAFVQSTQSSGSTWGKLLLNPSGGNIGINYSNAASVTFPLDINQSSNVFGLRLSNTLDGTNNNWDLFSSNNGAFYFSRNGINKGYVHPIDGSWVSLSDARFKKDIQTMGTVLDRVMALQPKTYQYNDNKKSDRNSTGFLAQEVMPLFPELVSDFQHPTKDTTDHTIYHGINYAGFGVVAIKAIQEQQYQIDVLKSEYKMLKDKMAKLEMAVAAIITNKK